MALPGETVKTRAPYPLPEVLVPPGHIWVEGEDWRMSKDSNEYGPVRSFIISRFIHRSWRIQQRKKKQNWSIHRKSTDGSIAKDQKAPSLLTHGHKTNIDLDEPDRREDHPYHLALEPRRPGPMTDTKRLVRDNISSVGTTLPWGRKVTSQLRSHSRMDWITGKIMGMYKSSGED